MRRDYRPDRAPILGVWRALPVAAGLWALIIGAGWALAGWLT